MLGRSWWRGGKEVSVCFESQGKYSRAIGDDSVRFGVEEEPGDFAGQGGFFLSRERGLDEALVKDFGALDGGDCA